uniref:Integrase n=1 Tax=Agrobacterium tumefaciens TaxID=358 RepID=Q7WUA7_AGRTU|nr:integrase [Agrobacterium radiobacter]
MMILELHRQGLSVTAIARRTGRDPKTVRKYIERGVELPVYGPRKAGRPSKIAPYMEFLRERVTAFPDLTASRLTREIREMGYVGAYTAVKRYLAAIRPDHDPKPYEVRFETKAGVQGQVDFARFVVEFTDEPGVQRIVWLFSLVLGYSRFLFCPLCSAPGSADAAALSYAGLRGAGRRTERDIRRFVVEFTDEPGVQRIVWLFSLVLGYSRFLFARYVLHQDLQTLLRCHMQAFEALGGVPIEILYDRMKTAVTGEDDQGHIVYNRSLLALAQHYRFSPGVPPYSDQTKARLRRSFRYIREDFFLGRSLHNLDGHEHPPHHLARHRCQCPRAWHDPERGRRRLRRGEDRAAYLPEHRFNAVLKLERRVSHDGLVAVGGNYYSVPDRTRRVVEVEQLPDLIRIIDRGIVVAEHPVIEGRRQYRIDRLPPHRTTSVAHAGATGHDDRPDRRPCATALAGGL